MAIVVVVLLLLLMGGKASISSPGVNPSTRPPPSPQGYPGYNPYAYGQYPQPQPDPFQQTLNSGISALGSFFSHQSSSSSPGSSTPSSAFTSDALAVPDFGGSSSSYVPDTATSNYLADTTATSDSASGVVGFGGWDG